MWVDGLPADFTNEFDPAITEIASLETVTTTINIQVPASAGAGTIEFTVYVQANDVIVPILEQMTGYTTYLQIHAVPEVPLGTAIALVSMVGAVGLYIRRPKAKKP